MSTVATTERVKIAALPDEPEEANFNGYSAAQLLRALETITHAALALRDYLVYARMRAEGHGSSRVLVTTDLQLAQHAAERIGSLADQLCGRETLDSAANWFTGDDITPAKGAS